MFSYSLQYQISKLCVLNDFFIGIISYRIHETINLCPLHCDFEFRCGVCDYQVMERRVVDSIIKYLFLCHYIRYISLLQYCN